MPNTETINWGWLNDATGNKFAPITFYEKIYTEDGKSLKDMLENEDESIVVKNAHAATVLKNDAGDLKEIGGLSRPVYFKGGKPEVIGPSLEIPDKLILRGRKKNDNDEEIPCNPVIQFKQDDKFFNDDYIPSPISTRIKWNGSNLIIQYPEKDRDGEQTVARWLDKITLNPEHSKIDIEELDSHTIYTSLLTPAQGGLLGIQHEGLNLYNLNNPDAGSRICIQVKPNSENRRQGLEIIESSGNILAKIDQHGIVNCPNVQINDIKAPTGEQSFVFVDNDGKLKSQVILPDELDIRLQTPESEPEPNGDESILSKSRINFRRKDPKNTDGTDPNFNRVFARIESENKQTEEETGLLPEGGDEGESIDKYSYLSTLSLYSEGNVVNPTEERIKFGLSIECPYYKEVKHQNGYNITSYKAADKGYIKASPNTIIKGAAWNDYAEYRNQINDIEPGYCVASTDDGKVYKTNEKLQACDGIVSDTFGFSIGETKECRTPIAVAGRVLAYCEGDRNDYHAGDTVCASANGKICKMTREEIREYPDRIVGIVSEIPQYKVWENGIEIKDRIWVKVK